MKLFNKVIFFLCFYLFFVPFAYAVDVDVNYFGDGGIAYGGGGGGGGTNSFYGYIGYRLTLVDSNGNKVDGTRSVDFQYSDSFKIIKGKQSNLLYENYKYRFGENNANDYIRIGLNVLPFKNNVYNPDSHSEFINNYVLKYYENAIFSIPDVEEKVDFISLFLYYAGYIKDTNSVKPYSQLIIDYPALNNYFISVELLVGLGTEFNSSLNKIGTGVEALEFMRSGTSLGNTYRDNMSDEKLTFACGLFTTPGFKEKYSSFNRFQKYYNSYEECVRESLTNYSSKKESKPADPVYLWTGNSCKTKNGWAYGVQGLSCGGVQQYGYGVQIENLDNYNVNKNTSAVGVAMISMHIGNTSNVYNSNLDLCKNNSVRFNSGVKTYALGNSLFKMQEETDENQSLYCYDNVTYNYSDVVSHLGGNKTQNFIIPTDGDSSPKIKATVVRQCYSNSRLSLESDFLTQIKSDYSKPITVNVYGKSYSFYPDFSNVNVTPDRNVDRVANTYSFEYKLNSPIYYNGLSSGQGYIDFSNYSQMFGASSKFIDEMLKHDNSECNNERFKKSSTNCYGPYGLTFNNLSDDGKCSFSYSVTGSKSKSDPNSFYKFRVISLENPFPGRDGTSRMPAKNWFYNENYVYDYIMNNRGIKSIMHDADASPESMYSNVEPMYKIILTPSTMLKIREYNKKYSYYSMYDTSGYVKMSGGEKSASQIIKEKDYSADKMICKDDRECFSKFLRDSKIIPQDDLSGSCVLIKNTTNEEEIRTRLSDYYSTYSDIPTGPLFDFMFGYGEPVDLELYDLNKNYRVDRVDYEMLLRAQADSAALTGSNTAFYTCANKTYYSGGPIKIEGVD